MSMHDAGQTKRPLKTQIAEHKAAICSHNMDDAIARHYVQANHGSAASLKFWGIEKNLYDVVVVMVDKLLKREAFWVYTFNTVEPYGQNEGLSLSYFL